MSKHKLALTSVRIRNYKSIHDTGTLQLGAFNLVVGNNGSGKSSLVEGLGALDALTSGLANLMKFGRGFGSFRHQPPEDKSKFRDVEWQIAGHDDFGGQVPSGRIRLSTRVGPTPGQEKVVQILSESLRRMNGEQWDRDADGRWLRNGESTPFSTPQLSLASMLGPYWRTWQFLVMNPAIMGDPRPASMGGEHLQLAPDGSNIAEYLFELQKRDWTAFQGIVDALKFVLPYADDLQVRMRSEADRSVWLELKEGRRTIPGWMLSTGTLRTVALLACLRNPTPPRLLVIEELENGLDPRTIGLIIEEIRNATNSGRTQVIATTHSPYLLNLVPIESVILAQREDGATVFRRPASDPDVVRWAEKFAPGDLYTRDRLTGGRS
ncbi:MAG: AAA family ATPase [Myxococcota bacterium]